MDRHESVTLDRRTTGESDQYFTWVIMERDVPRWRRRRRPEQRIQLGWSLAIATVANLVLGVTAIATGATLVGVVACSALSIATCLLVLAEIACRYGIDPMKRVPPALDDRRARPPNTPGQRAGYADLRRPPNTPGQRAR